MSEFKKYLICSFTKTLAKEIESERKGECINQGMIMEGIRKAKAKKGKNGAGHAATRTGNSRRIVNGAANPGNMEK